MRIVSILFIMMLFISVSTHARAQLPIKPEGQSLPEQPELQTEKNLAFNDLRQSVDALQTDSAALMSQLDKEEKEKLESLLTRTENNLKYLQFSSIGKDVPEEYLKSLRLNAQLLRAVREQKSMTKGMMLIVGVVASDLEVKADSAQQCKDGPYNSIDILAHTKRGKDDVNGFEIRWVPTGSPNGSGNLFGGGDPVSPVKGKLVNGNYFMWSQDPSNDQRRGNRKPFTAHCNGDKQVHLPAP